MSNRTQFTLEQCTEAHLSFNEKLRTETQKLPLSNAFCAPIGAVLKLQGKIASPLFSYLKLNITRCNSTVDPTCANNTIFSAIEAAVGSFMAGPFFINMNVNPGNQNYKEYYI